MNARQILDNIVTKGRSLWSRLSPGRRVVAVMAAVGVIAVVGVFLAWSQATEYAVLYTDVEEREAAEIVAMLKEAKVPYQLVGNGDTIKVPVDQVHDLRLQLAAEGLPKGGTVGMEIFDETNLAVTDFAQRLNYQRALEGELARTISQLAPVASARVHLVIPQPELYKSKEREATASVVVNLRPGRELEPSQVRAIANLVAGSVEGLKPQNLTIVDSRGNILSDGQSDPSLTGQLSSNQLELQRSYERWQESRVHTMLDQVLGPGKAAVRVNAELDWNQVEQTSEIYNPEDQPGLLRSSHETRETAPAGGALTGGIPGTGSNLPSYTGVTAEGEEITGETQTTTTGSEGTTERVEIVQNFELSKTVERLVKAPGSVRRLSVAVVLDDVADAAQLASVKDVVAAAVGLDEERGDVISVTSLPFDKSVEEAERALAAEAQQQELYRNIAYGVAAVLALVVLAFFARRLTRSMQPAQPVPALATTVVPSVAPPAAAQPVAPPQPTHALPAADPVESAFQSISTIAKRQPQLVAEVVKYWLEQK